MRLGHAYLAKFAETSSEGTISVGGADFDLLGVPKVPANVGPIMLVVKFWFSPDEVGEHLLDVELIRPDGSTDKILNPMQIVASNHKVNPEWETGAGALIAVKLGIQQFGMHQFRVMLDGTLMATVPLAIIDSTESPAA